MHYYNNAAKIFGVKEVLRRRFVDLAIRKRFDQSERTDYQCIPLEYFFYTFFLIVEDCVEGYGKR